MSDKKNILITGGSGLIGKILTNELIEKGYNVSHLNRSPGKDMRVKTFLWDVKKGLIDQHCIDGIDTIVHLAGAGIADKRWTNKRKKILINSRTKSIGLIYDLIKNKKNTVQYIISASAIGYYGNREDEILTEDSEPGNGFLSECCIEWEKAVDEGEKLGLSITKFRTGVVLNAEGGALPQMAFPVKIGLGSPLGSGRQWIPWIHWQDVAGMYVYGIENQLPGGVYNMVAPRPVTNKEQTKAVARQLHRPLWLPKVPAFVLKLLLGEMSAVVLGSTRVSSSKIEKEGFKFKFPVLTEALKEIYGQ